MKTYKLSNNSFWWDQWDIMVDSYPEVFNRDLEPSDDFIITKQNKRWLHIEMTDRARDIIKEYAHYKAGWINYPDLDDHSLYRQCATIVKQITNQI